MCAVRECACARARARARARVRARAHGYVSPIQISLRAAESQLRCFVYRAPMPVQIRLSSHLARPFLPPRLRHRHRHCCCRCRHRCCSPFQNQYPLRSVCSTSQSNRNPALLTPGQHPSNLLQSCTLPNIHDLNHTSQHPRPRSHFPTPMTSVTLANTHDLSHTCQHPQPRPHLPTPMTSVTLANTHDLGHTCQHP
jgi:hypothetical protein